MSRWIHSSYAAPLWFRAVVYLPTALIVYLLASALGAGQALAGFLTVIISIAVLVIADERWEERHSGEREQRPD